jgi:carboxylesterase type B
MFWIHGGGFLYGSSSLEIYDAAYLAAKGDIIIVTINYRLSTFGFLYTGTDDAPGNAGLYDQALALKWVKDNIEHFGGNPNEITIFGQSVGSYSVSLHLLSPITRNLF